MEMTRRTFGMIAGAFYFAGGLMVGWDFVNTPTQVAASSMLWLHVFPLTAATRLAPETAASMFSALQHALGYRGGHVAVYLPSLILCTNVFCHVLGGKKRS